MCDLVATTEVSYWKGIESIVPPAHIFQRVVQSRCKIRADDRDEAVRKNVSIGRRVVVPSLVVAFVSVLLERDGECHIACNMVPLKVAWGEVTV
jgi:hypothetical protein